MSKQIARSIKTPMKVKLSKPKSSSMPKSKVSGGRRRLNNADLVPAMIKPMSIHAKEVSSTKSSLRQAATVFIETLMIPGNVAVPNGTIIWSRRNTVSIPNTSLAVQSLLYNRWRVHRWTYRFVPSVAISYAGSIIGATDPDPLSSYTVSSSNVGRLTNLPGMNMSNASQGITFSHPLQKDFTDLWVVDLNPSTTDFTDRFCAAGNSMIAVSSTGDIFGGQEIGVILLDYDIELYDPRLDATALSCRPTIGLGTPTNIFNLLADALSGYGAGNIPICDWFMKLIGKIPSTTALSTLTYLSDIIRTKFEWSSWTSAFSSAEYKMLKGSAAPTETAGFPPGNYNLQLVITRPNSATGPWTNSNSPLIYFNTPINSDTLRVVGQGGDCIEYISYDSVAASYGVISPITAVRYKYAIRVNLSFYITQSRGYYDTRFSANSTPATDIAEAWFEFTSRDNATFAVPSFTGGSSVIGQKVSPSEIESKLESKTVATPELKIPDSVLEPHHAEFISVSAPSSPVLAPVRFHRTTGGASSSSSLSSTAPVTSSVAGLRR